MLNCMATCRGTDKKPCDNNLKAFPSEKLVASFDNMGGEDMFKKIVASTSLTSISDTVDKLSDTISAAIPKIAFDDERLGD